jgi:glycosyltransferase involved in cell wall biosynthesis
MISIVIPVYNRAHYIKDCIDSVLQQTYKDYEIIVVDDGSTDNVREVLQPYMNIIRYIYKENGGAASARNEGIRNAKGEYIAWLDSDDRWFPFKLELEIKILEKQQDGIGFLHSDFSCFTNEKGRIADSYIRAGFTTFYRNFSSYDTIYAAKCSIKDMGIEFNSLPSDTTVYWGNVSNCVILGPMFLPSSVLMRTGCVNKMGFFNENFRTGEDFDYLARTARKYNVTFIDYPTLEYRRFHSDQLSCVKMENETNKMFLRIAVDLGLNDKEYYHNNKKQVQIRVSQCYFDIGIYYYEHSCYLQALHEFIASIKIYFTQKKVYLYLLLSLWRLSGSFFLRKRQAKANKLLFMLSLTNIIQML